MKYIYTENTKSVFSQTPEDKTFVLSNYKEIVKDYYDTNCNDWEISLSEKEEIEKIGFVGAYCTIDLYVYHTGYNGKGYLQCIATFTGGALWGIQADDHQGIADQVMESKQDLKNNLALMGVPKNILNQF